MLPQLSTVLAVRVGVFLHRDLQLCFADNHINGKRLKTVDASALVKLGVADFKGECLTRNEAASVRLPSPRRFAWRTLFLPTQAWHLPHLGLCLTMTPAFVDSLSAVASISVWLLLLVLLH